MRNLRFTLAACAVVLAGVSAAGAGALAYGTLGGRSRELERQNASLLGAYDELRGFAVECLAREEERVVADTYRELAASSSDAARRAATDAVGAPSRLVSAGRSGPGERGPGTSRTPP